MNLSALEYDELPKYIQNIINRYGVISEHLDTYEGCRELLLELKNVGYTFEFGLDAIPYDIRPIYAIERPEGFEDWIDEGNVIRNSDGTYSTQDALYQNKLIDLKALKTYFIKEFLT